MSFATIVQSGEALANTLTDSLQASVTHKAYASDDGYGKPTYATGVVRKAIVERRQKFVRNELGEEKLSLARVLFVGPVTVGEQDLITLPDGSEMPIVRITGPVDPTTNAEFLVEVELG